VQVRYAATSIEGAKSARARGSYLRVSFKNTRETAQAINGWKLERALTYLGNVLEHKEAVPMRRYAGGTGRTAQGELPIFRTRWPGWRRAQWAHGGARSTQFDVGAG
jgi:large subunit ribosomal protein L17e